MADALHSRLRFAASGDLTIGHVALGLFGYYAARCTGGTFTLRVTNLKATRVDSRWVQHQKFVDRNLADLRALGLDASPPQAFLAHGLSPSYRVCREDERALTDYYWRELGFDKVWGAWPCNDSDNNFAGNNFATSNDWHSFILGNYEQSWCHPYLRLAQVVGDVTTGRNVIFRGEDHWQDAVMTNAFAHAVARLHYRLTEVDRLNRYVPAQWFLPKLRDSQGRVFSSGNPAVTTGYYVRDFLKSKLLPERLFAFLQRVLFTNAADAERMYSGWSAECLGDRGRFVDPKHPNTHEAIKVIFDSIRKEPVVDEVAWAVFKKTGEVPEWSES